VNFTFEGHAIVRKRGLRVLNEDELKNGDVSLEYVSRLMNRRYTESPTFRKILQTIWYQINSGREIYVIGEILDDKTVKGGTGWGAEFAKICNKPLYVFDQKRNSWFIWKQMDWVECKGGDEPVISHVHFTGTGTRFLEENGRGFDIHIAKVPIVPAAILLDLGLGNPLARPDAPMGYEACVKATGDTFERGNVGAGTGATVGKILGMGRAMKGGLGTACVEIAGGVKVGALVAVNAFGDVINPSTGAIVAGARRLDDTGFVNTARALKDDLAGSIFGFTNTVIGLVATNAFLTKEDTNKVAQMASNGIARTVSPAHTSFDGDVVFALSRAESELVAPVSAIGSAAAEAIADAVLDAVMCAESIQQVPAARDLHFSGGK